tara:strand:- start:151 stop:642 length:492 start_codon:yes stop_codon:yes gene_type:complete
VLKKSCFIFLITFVLGNFSFADQKDKWSLSMGQFDVNYRDQLSSEIRLEYLYGKKFYENSFNLKQFIGVMRNGDNGSYLYTGLRKDIEVSSKWNFTPSFALGYYDRGKSLDLGYNLEFRSQIEFSYALGESRIGFNLNHISNASLGNTNPGTESATVSLIRSF